MNQAKSIGEDKNLLTVSFLFGVRNHVGNIEWVQYDWSTTYMCGWVHEINNTHGYTTSGRVASTYYQYKQTQNIVDTDWVQLQFVQLSLSDEWRRITGENFLMYTDFKFHSSHTEQTWMFDWATNQVNRPNLPFQNNALAEIIIFLNSTRKPCDYCFRAFNHFSQNHLDILC